MDTSKGSYAVDGQKSTETPEPVSGDVKARMKRANAETKRQAGDTGERKKGPGYISKKAKNKYYDQLDEAGKI